MNVEFFFSYSIFRSTASFLNMKGKQQQQQHIYTFFLYMITFCLGDEVMDNE